MKDKGCNLNIKIQTCVLEKQKSPGGRFLQHDATREAKSDSPACETIRAVPADTFNTVE